MVRSALVLSIALALAACGSEPAGTDAATGPEASTQSTDAPHGAPTSAGPTLPDGGPEELAEETAASGAEACLVGTWEMDAAQTFRAEQFARIVPMEGARFSFGGDSGRALLVFGPDGQARQRWDDFSVTINASVMGVSVGVVNQYEGTASARYTVEEGRLVFEPGEADMSSTVIVNGQSRPNPFATESLFEQAERGRSAFTCSGDVLTLDIRDPQNDETLFTEVRYTRAA